MYTVRPPIGGRNTLMSGRVISSGYIPPVSSNSPRRSNDSVLSYRHSANVHGRINQRAHMPNLSATPGKYHTGSMAALLTGSSTPGSTEDMVPSSFNRGRDLTTNLPSIGNDIFGSGWSISESLICARVIAMLGRTSRPPAISVANT